MHNTHTYARTQTMNAYSWQCATQVLDLRIALAERLFCIPADVTLYASEEQARGGGQSIDPMAVLADEIDGGPLVRSIIIVASSHVVTSRTSCVTQSCCTSTPLASLSLSLPSTLSHTRTHKHTQGVILNAHNVMSIFTRRSV